MRVSISSRSFLLSVLIYILFIEPFMAMLASSGTRKRVALITGANKGIGYEIARLLGAEKDTLCILGCRNEALGKAAVIKLNEEGCDTVFVKIDLDDIHSIEDAARWISDTYGKCDVLINNAAVCFNDPTLYGKVAHTPFAKQAEITIKTNFFGTLAVTRSILPLLNKSTSPMIINIASSAGRLSILPSKERQAEFQSDDLTIDTLESYMSDFVRDAQDGNHTSKGWPNTGYGVSKVGVIAMTKVIARENPEFMVNSVDPGYCATDQNNNQGFIPAKRGAMTPYLLANVGSDQFFSGMHWYEEQAINWSYQ